MNDVEIPNHEFCTTCKSCLRLAPVYETYKGYFCRDCITTSTGITLEQVDRAVREGRMPIWYHPSRCDITALKMKDLIERNRGSFKQSRDYRITVPEWREALTQ